MTAPITIQDYDPLWPQTFETIRSRIAAVLDELATAIEHVGSTAVTGLAAKAVIDIDVLLRSSSDLLLVITRLASLGYEHRGDLGIAGREALRVPPNDFAHHLYVCAPNNPEFIRHIAFRDYLRAHPEEAKAYARLKRTLAEHFGIDRIAYNNAKSEFVAEILRRAARTPHGQAGEIRS